MITVFAFCLLLYAVVGSPAFIHSGRGGRLYWSDIATPVFVVALWVFVVASGYGHQSLSHFVEVPIALGVALGLFYGRVFIIDRFSDRYRINSYVVLGVSLLCVVLLRTFMPYLPE